PNDRLLHRETEQWIFSDDRSWYLSFTNLCEVLDLNPDEIRRTLRARKASRRNEARGSAA
ncbi:MAG: hypothetical protein ACREQ9_04190, partial [Candidatus Binatia bacterium]